MAADDPLAGLVYDLERDREHHERALAKLDAQIAALRGEQVDPGVDVTTEEDRRQVRQLEELFRLKGRRSNDRKPAGPTFGGPS